MPTKKKIKLLLRPRVCTYKVVVLGWLLLQLFVFVPDHLPNSIQTCFFLFGLSMSHLELARLRVPHDPEQVKRRGDPVLLFFG